MKTIEFLNLITALSSLAAGILWLVSSKVLLNTRQGIALGELGKVVNKQSRISAWAAIFATVAALSQSMIFFFKP